MEKRFDGLTDRQLLAVVDDALNALSDDRLRLPTAAEQLELLQECVRLAGRMQALQQQVAAAVDRSEAVWDERRTSARTWLAESMNLTPREAARIIAAGHGLTTFPVVGTAALGGAVLPVQAEAITGVLADLPKDFPDETVVQAQQLMVDFAQTHNSAELRRLTAHLVETLSPETADEIEAKRLERQERRAQAHRFLDFSNDGQGSVLIRGSLPVAAAEPLIRIVQAYAAAQKRGADRLDPLAEYVTPGMRRADGLVAMVDALGRQGVAPVHGGDRPRIVVTLSYDKLVKQCLDAGLGARLTRSGDPLPASVARRLLCDADILPVVLGGESEPLDVGRTQRLVTPPIRAALEVRDGGCVFPGCDKPPEACEAHHIIPWWAGGETSLQNLVLACPHHHGIVEPGRDPTADRWHVRLRDDGVPVVFPPRRVDPRQRPRVHARFTTRG
nr:HNH endonuclease signature motif containing protein [Propionicimonas sp.]